MARRKSYDELKAEIVAVFKWMENNSRFNPKNRSGTSSGDDSISSLRSRLQELKELHDDDLINEDEYEYWKAQILQRI